MGSSGTVTERCRRGGGHFDAVRGEPGRTGAGVGVAAGERPGERVDAGGGRIGQGCAEHAAETGPVDVARRAVLAEAAHAPTDRLGGLAAADLREVTNDPATLDSAGF